MPQATPRPSKQDSHAQTLLDEHARHRRPAYARLWDYYRNPEHKKSGVEAGAAALAQCRGLPDRLKPSQGQPREIVIENDIAWRVQTLVDFMFGKPPVLQSLASDPNRAEILTRFVRAVIEANGGAWLFQNMALMGTVYGHVDLLLTVGPGGRFNLADPAQAAERFKIEPVDAQRGIPMTHPDDYRLLEGYMVQTPRRPEAAARPGMLERVRDRVAGVLKHETQSHVDYTTRLWTDAKVTLFRTHRATGRRTAATSYTNRLGRVPVVHIQNLPQPLVYSGLSEVEPLIPLQDELNTRLSDRANRITLQAFKMYLGRGIERFTERPVSPGQMWHTDNPEASIQEFGGDADSPSEDAHISDIRDALDKTSGVSPVAAGVIRGKVGNLTSQNAVHLVLMGLLARVERKRVTYGQGIERLCELVLHAADVYGILPNTPDERRIRIDWPDPIPENQAEQLDIAQRKIDLGVPRETVLNELGYGECTSGEAESANG